MSRASDTDTYDEPVPTRQGVYGATRMKGEAEESWLARKCDRQRVQIERLEALLAASKAADLARRCIEAEGRAAVLADRLNQRDSAYVKGYGAGYMAALARHGLDRP